jgi:hypothetical protein
MEAFAKGVLAIKKEGALAIFVLELPPTSW